MYQSYICGLRLALQETVTSNVLDSDAVDQR